MLVDARDIDPDSTLSTDVCIIGGGLAGLVIARDLATRGTAVCVLESGGLEPDDATRDLYRGDCGELPYEYADGCRSRYLGGSSNCWGGWCRPMEPIDFEQRSWVADSGWPFGPEELLPYYRRAHPILQLGPFEYDQDFWIRAIARPDVRRMPLSGQVLGDGISQFSPPLQAGKVFRAELAQSGHIRVLLHANVTAIVAAEDLASVRQVQVRTLTGRGFTVQGRRFVLATGGIENARLLLASNAQAPAGLGNAHDLVGRYFMDHPRITSGHVRLAPQWRGNKLYDNKFQYQNHLLGAHGTRIAAQFVATPEVQRREGMLNARLSLASIFPGEHSAAGDAIRRLRRRWEKAESPGPGLWQDLASAARHPWQSAGFCVARVFHPQYLIRGVRVQATCEPAPNRDSRVTLSQRRDALGMPRVKVDWRLPGQVKHTFDRMLALLKQELEAAGVAQVDLDPPIGEEGAWPDTFVREGNWHHMGTTRMHDSPRQGVVDRHCRVHGLHNLYIAGSSVFPTAAADYPTITLTALALRLADHLGRAGASA